ncbi:hypothetical protein IL306_006696 [Fusarium sp. DS 682]|nr:hypothetical protein IL306_006696 [Fusarium sp. DS 682]
MRLETAAWDAYTLSVSASKNPDTGDKMAVWRAYVGPDYSEQLDRMIVNDKPVAGYGWTYRGWLGDYHNVALCDRFFGLPDLEEKTEFIEQQLQEGNTKYAEGAVWQKNMGQFFLHEMMHLDSVGKPHINDEDVSKGGNSIRAYGPKYVYKLAQLNLRSGGGATRASTNADTYAWLANCLYFFELTKYFPKPPNYKSSQDINSDDEGSDDQYPLFLNLGDFDQDTATDEELHTRVEKELEAFESSTLEGTAACWKHDVSISIDTADSFIEDFCKEISLSNLLLVPASSEVPQDDDKRVSKVGTPGISLPGRDEKLYFEVKSSGSCRWGYPLGIGDNDEQKVNHCKVRFGKIMNDCEAADAGLAAGGDYIDGCAKYSIRLA